MGILRPGLRTSPLTIFRSFHPSYAQRAAISAAMNPAKPPVAPGKIVEKLRHVPLAALNPSRAIARMIAIFTTVNTTRNAPAGWVRIYFRAERNPTCGKRTNGRWERGTDERTAACGKNAKVG